MVLLAATGSRSVFLLACIGKSRKFICSRIALLHSPIPTTRDGNDGPWSTFGVLVGTPSTNLRVLPATGGSSLWVVHPDGCTDADPSSCPDDRGLVFSANESSTWDQVGLYGLPLVEEEALGLSGNALVGRDMVTLGWQSDHLPTLEDQVVAAVATKDFYIGSLGLTPRPENITSFEKPMPSILGTLSNQSKIPSASWGYTAGAFFTSPKTFGSLTLGGYDESRFVKNDVSFNFGSDFSRDLLVGISSISTITTSGNTTVLQSGTFAFVDSLVPHIWLPPVACDGLERAFGLVYDNATELYLISEELDQKLSLENPSVTFKLTPSLSTQHGEVEINIPYAALSLTAKAPIVQNSSRYFPLKRAENDTQYTLGRAFLQAAYVVVDYERSRFSVSQALYPDSSVPQKIVAIRSPGASSAGLSTGAIVGIVIAAVLAIVAIIAAIIFHRRRLARRSVGGESQVHPPPHDQTQNVDRSELDATTQVVAEKDATARLHKANDKAAFEVPVTENKHELPAQSPWDVYEMSANHGPPKSRPLGPGTAG